MIKTGITERIFRHSNTEVKARLDMNSKRFMPRTVDSDGNTLVESVPVSAHKSRDLSKLVDLQVLSVKALGRLGLDNLEVDVVRLCNCTNGSRTWVALSTKIVSSTSNSKRSTWAGSWMYILRRYRAFRMVP